MFRCLIRNGLLLFVILTAAAGADTNPAWEQFARCLTLTGLVFEDSICWIGTDECGLGRFSPLSGVMRFVTNQNSPLPSNSVNCLAIGRDGVKWIGTDEGLARYDGAAWSIFRTGNAPFPGNSVSACAIDDSGNVWVGFTDGGVLVYSQNNWTDLLQKRPGYPLTLAGNTVNAIAPVNDHDAWISWNSFLNGSYGLAFFDQSGWQAYGYPNVRWMAPGMDGAVWFCVTEWAGMRYRYGLVRLGYPDSLATYLAPEAFFPSNTYAYLQAVAIDDAGRKWIGSGNRVLRLSDTVWTQLPFLEDTMSVKGFIYGINFDRTGAAWAGFSCTVYDKPVANPIVARLTGSDTWIKYPVPGSGIPFNDVLSICPIHGGGAWVGANNGIARYNSGKWERVSFSDTVLTGAYGEMCSDGNNGLWITKPYGFINTDGQHWKVLTLPKYGSLTAMFIYTDGQGIIWVCIPDISGQWYTLVGFDAAGNIIDEQNVLPSFVIGMAGAPDKSLWVALYNNGLRHRGADGVWTEVTAGNSSLPSDTITGIVCGPNGKLWAGTQNHGLTCFANGQWTRYDTLNSDIPGQYTKPLCVDTLGNLWLVARPIVKKCRYSYWYFDPSDPVWYCYDSPVPNGLVKYDGLHWTVYNTLNSGLPSNTVNAAAPGDSGRIWVGTDKGLALFHANYVDGIDRGPGPHTKAAGDGNRIRFQIRNGVVTLYAPYQKIVSVLIFDAAGKKVRATGDASAANGKAAISLSRLPAGFYFARISMQPAEGLSNIVQKHFVVLEY
jgi:ligand-binding sensor domain-containing protein